MGFTLEGRYEDPRHPCDVWAQPYCSTPDDSNSNIAVSMTSKGPGAVEERKDGIILCDKHVVEA